MKMVVVLEFDMPKSGVDEIDLERTVGRLQTLRDSFDPVPRVYLAVDDAAESILREFRDVG